MIRWQFSNGCSLLQIRTVTGKNYFQSDVTRRGANVPRKAVYAFAIGVALSVVAILTGRCAEAARTWTSSGGNFTIEADFVGFSEGKVSLRKADGKQIEVPLDKLSEADRRWVAAEVRRRRTSEAETKTDENSAVEPAAEEPEEELGSQSVELKLVPLKFGRGRKPDPATQYFLGMTGAQAFLVPTNAAENRFEKQFREIVGREPEYAMDKPVRAVAKLGADEYAFALDAKGKNPKGYNTLYFDANHNGDLTDDKPIEAVDVQSDAASGASQSQFADIRVPLESGEAPFDYHLCMAVTTGTSEGVQYALAQIKAGAVREGRIQQGGRTVRLVLLDQNSNGRFDDAISIRSTGMQLSLQEGDLLLVNPNIRSRALVATASVDRHFVSRTVCIGRHFYKMEITPSGDRLSLEPVEPAVGHVTNAGPLYRATVYSDDYGVLLISGQGDQKIPLLQGEWKLANYTVAAPGGTAVTATFGSDPLAVRVDKGQTVPLKFGAPFRTEVTSRSAGDKGIYLSLQIIGAGGAQCTGVQINGKRPDAPRFEIRDKGGKVVHQGRFEWG